MAARVLITMDDLETAVPLNAAWRPPGYTTAMLSSMDDARAALRRANPDLVVLTGAVHEPHSVALAAMARDHEISTLALLEPTDSERTERVVRLGVTETMMKPARADEVLETARRLLERRGLQERTGIIGESAAIQEVLVKIEQMAPVSSTVLVQGESGTGKELVARATPRPLARGGASRSSRSTAPRCRRRCWRASCSATRRGPSPAPPSGGWGGSSWPTAAPSSSTRSARSRPAIQVKLLRVLESRTFVRVGGTVSRSRWTSGWSPPPTATSARRWRRASSGRTSTTGSTSSTSTSPRCASGGRTSPSWCAGSSGSSPGRTTARSAGSPRRRCSGW